MGYQNTGITRILFLRIGMDLGFGGLGPLFPDGTFEYVPIPDDPERVSERSLFFRDIPARSGGTVARFVPARHRESPAHYDPEFDTFTYGDPTKNKRGQLLRLDKAGKPDKCLHADGKPAPIIPRSTESPACDGLDEEKQ